jgi:hypothetical protein
LASAIADTVRRCEVLPSFGCALLARRVRNRWARFDEGMMPKQKAQIGLQLMQDAVMELLSEHREGLTNAQIGNELGLQSDYQGHHQGYLSWSIMGLLLNAKKVEKRGRRYCLLEH